MTYQHPGQQPYPGPHGQPPRPPAKKRTSPWVWVGLMLVVAVVVGLVAGLARRGGESAPAATAAPNTLTAVTVAALSEDTKKRLANRACRAEVELPSGAKFMDQGQAALVMKDGSNKVIVAGKVLLATGDRRSWRCEALVYSDRDVQVLTAGLAGS